MGLYKLNDFQEFDGQLGTNVFYYESTSMAPTAFDLCLAYVEMVIPAMRACQSVTCIHMQVEVVNLENVADFYSMPLGTTFNGLLSSDPLPSSNTVTIRLNRSTTVVKNGRKGIGGITEGQVQGNSIAALALPDLQDLANILGSELTSSTSQTFKPVIARRPDPSVGVWQWWDVASATVRGLGTQVSRKKKHGL